MDKVEAIKQLEKTNEITSELLEPLEISMDNWLAYCQLDKKSRQFIVNGTLEILKNVGSLKLYSQNIQAGKE